MGIQIPRFSHGPRLLVDKLNQIIDALNPLINLTGSTFIFIKRAGNSVAVEVNYPELERRLKRQGSSSAPAAATVLLAEVLSQPAYAIDGGSAKEYYDVRLLNDGIAAYSASTTYAINAKCVGSDSFVYVSGADNNIGHDPTVSPTWWSKDPEFIISKIWGAANQEQKMTDTIPWINVGEVVLLIEYDGDKYIQAPSIMWTGEKEVSNLRQHPDGYPQSVFR